MTTSSVSARTVQELEQKAAGGPDTDEALRELRRLAEDRELPKPVRRLARLALHRLRSRGLEVDADLPPPASPAARVRLVQAVAGPILGDGQVGLVAVVLSGSGTTFSLRAAVSDRRGLQGLAVEEGPRREAQEALEQARRAEGVDLEAAEASAMLAGAVATARRAGLGLPVAFFTHRDLVEPLLAGDDPRPLAFAPRAWPASLREQLEVADEVLAAWVRASASLAEQAELARWSLPAEVMQARAEELRRLASGRVAVLAATARSQLDHHVLAALRQLCEPPWSALMAERLAYVALRSARRGQPAAARLAAAGWLALARPGVTQAPGALEALVRRELEPLVAGLAGRAEGPAAEAGGRPGPPTARPVRRTPSGLILP